MRGRHAGLDGGGASIAQCDRSQAASRASSQRRSPCQGRRLRYPRWPPCRTSSRARSGRRAACRNGSCGMNGSSIAWTIRPGIVDPIQRRHQAAALDNNRRPRRSHCGGPCSGRRTRRASSRPASRGGPSSGNRRWRRTTIGTEPSDEIPVVEPVLRRAHPARAGGQVDRGVGRQDAVEPARARPGRSPASAASFRTRLAPSEKPIGGDRRGAVADASARRRPRAGRRSGPRGRCPGPARIPGPRRGGSPGSTRIPMPTSRTPSRTIYGASAQPASPWTSMAVGRVPVPSRRRRLQHHAAGPHRPGQSHGAVEARRGLGSGQYLPAIVWAWPPRSQGCGSNGGRPATTGGRRR